jgi:hypothetical protein
VAYETKGGNFALIGGLTVTASVIAFHPAHAAPVTVSWQGVVSSTATAGTGTLPAGINAGDTAYFRATYDPTAASVGSGALPSTTNYSVPGTVSVTIDGNQWSGSISSASVTNDRVPRFGPMFDQFTFSTGPTYDAFPGAVAGAPSQIGMGLAGDPGMLFSRALPTSLGSAQLASAVNAPISLLNDIFSGSNGNFTEVLVSSTPATLQIQAAPASYSQTTKYWAGWYAQLFNKAGDTASLISSALSLSNGLQTAQGVAFDYAKDKSVTAALSSIGPYIGASAAQLYTLKSAIDQITQIGAVGVRSAATEAKLAGTLADITLSLCGYILDRIANDPANIDYQTVMHVVGGIDVAAVRLTLGQNAVADATVDLLQAAMQVIEGAIVSLSGAERGQGATAAGNHAASLAQAGALFSGLDEIQSASGLLGKSLIAWHQSLLNSGVLDVGPLPEGIAFDSITAEDAASIAAYLHSLGLFDATTIDQAVSRTLAGPGLLRDGSSYNLSAIGATLAASQSFDSPVASVPEPSTYALVLLGIFAANRARRGRVSSAG